MAAGGLDVLVVGAGVIGLSTAVHLAESGRVVEVRTSTVPGLTTSAAAGAMWSLSLVEVHERTMEWGRYTFERLCFLAGEPDTGVRMVSGVEASRRPATISSVQTLPVGAHRCGPAQLPAGFASGWRFTAPLIDMPTYLAYLQDRLYAAGGRLRVEHVRSLDDALAEAPVVVNCTGARAGELTVDHELYPMRGQLVVVANPGLTEFFAEETEDDADMLYILPHGDLVVLGGTAAAGAWDTEPDRSQAEAIIARCAEIEPRLAGARLIEHRVGLRPMRARVRLEEQAQPGGRRLIHSYGHGGAGVTLSWGSAAAVLARLGASVA